MPARIALIHGAATRPSVYDSVVAAIADQQPDADVLVPARASSGDLETELAGLLPSVQGRIVAGVSGGATLGLALLAAGSGTRGMGSGIRGPGSETRGAGSGIRGAVLHEPAAGSLAPGLLDAVAAAYRDGGVHSFARTLYGPSWPPEQAPDDAGAVARDLAMFRAFEPAPPADVDVRIVLTVGELSPPIRHTVVALLAQTFGFEVRVVPGCGHAAHLDAPAAWAAIVLAVSDQQAAQGEP